MLRKVDGDLSLHYWDWNTDPAGLFTESFMGSASDSDGIGEPWLSGGFYDPAPSGDNYRDEGFHSLNQSPPSYPLHANPADPPNILVRDKRWGAPPVGQTVPLQGGGTLTGPTMPSVMNADLLTSSWD